MSAKNLIVGVLTLVALIGVIVLTALDKSTDVVIPALTALLGLLAGINEQTILGGVKKLIKK